LRLESQSYLRRLDDLDKQLTEAKRNDHSKSVESLKRQLSKAEKSFADLNDVKEKCEKELQKELQKNKTAQKCSCEKKIKEKDREIDKLKEEVLKLKAEAQKEAHVTFSPVPQKKKSGKATSDSESSSDFLDEIGERLFMHLRRLAKHCGITVSKH
jgi:chromosome segregation ATPase